jgi:hypothetical protein
MPLDLDAIMQQASEALVRGQYLACETLCLQALAEARQRGDWAYYARILLPLQEARRQRRIIASEGTIRLGTADLIGGVEQWLSMFDAGCIAVTHPHAVEQAHTLAQLARKQHRYVEVLFVDSDAAEDRWVVRTFAAPSAICEMNAPVAPWLNRWISWPSDDVKASPLPPATPADWFLDACEALGDAVLAKADKVADLRQRVDLLEAALHVVPDHELLHQRLGDTARAMCSQNAPHQPPHQSNPGKMNP